MLRAVVVHYDEDDKPKEVEFLHGVKITPENLSAINQEIKRLLHVNGDAIEVNRELFDDLMSKCANPLIAFPPDFREYLQETTGDLFKRGVPSDIPTASEHYAENLPGAPNTSPEEGFGLNLTIPKPAQEAVDKLKSDPPTIKTAAGRGKRLARIPEVDEFIKDLFEKGQTKQAHIWRACCAEYGAGAVTEYYIRRVIEEIRKPIEKKKPITFDCDKEVSMTVIIKATGLFAETLWLRSEREKWSYEAKGNTRYLNAYRLADLPEDIREKVIAHLEEEKKKK